MLKCHFDDPSLRNISLQITPEHQVPLSSSYTHLDFLLSLVRLTAPAWCQSPISFLTEWAHMEGPLRSFPWGRFSKNSSSALTWGVSALNQKGAQHHQGHHESCHPWGPGDPQDHHPGAWERTGAERLAVRPSLSQWASLLKYRELGKPSIVPGCDQNLKKEPISRNCHLPGRSLG